MDTPADTAPHDPATPARRHDRASLMATLEAWGIATRTVDHEPLFTVAQSQAVHRRVEGAHTKNLFLTDRRGTLVLVTAAHDTAVDLKGLHRRLGCGRLSFAGPDELLARLGVTPGSVTAFAVINDEAGAVRFVLDAALMEAGTINAHPLENTATTSIARDDLVAFVGRTGHAVEVVTLTAG